jgi:hypothetical protein
VQHANYVDETDNIKAVFASLDVDIFKWLTVTAEGRYQEDTIRDRALTGATYQKTFYNPPRPPAPRRRKARQRPGPAPAARLA